MALFVIGDFTHWAAWEDFPFVWNKQYYLPAGVTCSVVCSSKGAIGSVAFNGVKLVVVDVAWTL